MAEEIIKSKNNDNENGSLKNIVLNKEGFNVGGDTLSKGYYPVLVAKNSPISMTIINVYSL